MILLILSLLSPSSGYSSFQESITTSTSAGRKLSSVPSNFPCLAALRISLRNIYPLPSLLGSTPSDTRKVIALAWSVIILIDMSFSGSFLYSTPDISSTFFTIPLIAAMSKIVSTPSITAAILSRPMPVSIFGLESG